MQFLVRGVFNYWQLFFVFHVFFAVGYEKDNTVRVSGVLSRNKSIVVAGRFNCLLGVMFTTSRWFNEAFWPSSSCWFCSDRVDRLFCFSMGNELARIRRFNRFFRVRFQILRILVCGVRGLYSRQIFCSSYFHVLFLQTISNSKER